MLGILDSKSVRFDVYTRDDKRIFDIEMQTSARKDLSKRARYYQSVIDMDNFSHGKSFARGTYTRDDSTMYWASTGACMQIAETIPAESIPKKAVLTSI